MMGWKSKKSTRSPADKAITILLADDHPLFRKAVRETLEKQADFTVIAEAGNGAEAVKLACELMPDMVIMDIGMPVLNGLQATQQIKAKCPGMAILVLTIYDDIEHILSILDAGAAGYLTKSVSYEDEIITAIRAISKGEIVMVTEIFTQVLKHALQYPLKPLVLDAKDTLTARELEILRLAARGLSNKDISHEMNLSLHTVKSYMVEIFAKLNVSSRTEAVITGLRARLITSDDIE
jgi:DNA-binding NarL/FixJ family response regulator